jgi:transglutaminase-like putative cysteine protease
MRLARTHRRLAVLMSLASLLAFAGGAGVQAPSALLATAGLVLAIFWQPSPALSSRLERLWLPLALLLAVRALMHAVVIRDDVVVPVVDLLFLLLTAEALRSVEAANDARIYSLSFALLLAATAYRPGLFFLLAFIAYVGLATLVLMVGHLRRESERHGSEQIPLPRSFLLGSLPLSVVTLTVAAIVFLTFPRVSQGWAGRGETLATSIAGFADEVTLGSHGSRIYGNPQIVLRVEFPNGRPPDLQSLYWRGRSYDRFDGIRWSRSTRIPPSQAPDAWYERWGREVLPQKIYAAPLDARVLFALHPLLFVDTEAHIQHISNNAGDHLYWGSGAPGYTAHSMTGRPSPSELRAARGSFTPAGDLFTQLPPLSSEIRSLADSLLTGLPTDYDRAVRLQRWFQEEFTYTLELPRTARDATLDHFLLHRREGHCEYFSTAMAILLRTQGVSTREVNGFVGGSWSQFGEYLAVTQNEAHAWVEVWFPEYGWVPFDPTPARRGNSMAATSWYWPGRFLLDAIQHRWNKWVLDYSLQTQFKLFELSRQVVAGASGLTSDSGNEAPRRISMAWVWWVLGAVVTVVAATWASRRTRKIPQETHIFLRLRDSVRRAGAPPSALHSPQALIGHLEAVGHPAAPAARRVVKGYIRARFSGLLMRTEEEKGMREALWDARNSLRNRVIR